MKCWLVAVGLVLASCATADRVPEGHYATAEEVFSAYLMNSQVHDPRFDRVPYNVKHAFSDCSAKYIDSKLSGTERFAIESGLRSGDLQWSDLAQIDGNVVSREGALTIDKLSGFCPAFIPGFRQYYGGQS